MNYFTCDVKLELQENCTINAPSGYSFETAVIVILFAISGFTSNDRAPGGPVTIASMLFHLNKNDMLIQGNPLVSR